MVVRKQIALLANEVIENVLSGLSIEFAPEDSRMSLAATCANAGATATLRLTDEVVLDTSELPVENAAGRGPVLPDDFLLTRQGVARGDHLILRIANTTGLGNTVDVIVDVSPI